MPRRHRDDEGVEGMEERLSEAANELSDSTTEPGHVEPIGLPSIEDFLSLVEDEQQTTPLQMSGYSVYHKYNKSC